MPEIGHGQVGGWLPLTITGNAVSEAIGRKIVGVGVHSGRADIEARGLVCNPRKNSVK
jgi:hypothetical protein